MIGDLKPYPSMKESGVPWLGRVPDHWPVLPNRALFAEIKDRNHPDEEMLSVTITKGVVKQKELLADSSKKDSSNLDRSKYKLVQPRDITYNKMRAWQGAIGVSDFRGIVSPAYVVLRLWGDANPMYFHYLCRTPQFAKEAERWSYGITSDMWSLRPEHFRLIYSLLPPRDEQDAIVRFVEHADWRIRNYIRTKQKLIKLLEEQKRIIIHRAVTRGLDPNVPLKPAGVRWLGEIPGSWETWQLGHFCRIGNGSTPSRSNPAYWSGGRYPWLNSSHANSERVTEANQFVTDAALRECHLPVVSPGSVLVAITGQGKTRGKATVLCIEATINQHLAFVRPRTETCSPTFLQAVLAGAYPFLRATSDDSGSTRGALTCTGLSHFKVALPPSEEQGRILATIGSQTRSTDDSIRKAIRETELLHEYRTRLASDVVTGKLDVRTASEEVAAGVPKLILEATESELAEEDPELTDTDFEGEAREETV